MWVLRTNKASDSFTEGTICHSSLIPHLYHLWIFWHSPILRYSKACSFSFISTIFGKIRILDFTLISWLDFQSSCVKIRLLTCTPLPTRGLAYSWRWKVSTILSLTVKNSFAQVSIPTLILARSPINGILLFFLNSSRKLISSWSKK